MRASIFIIAFSALAVAQSSVPTGPSATSQPLIPTGDVPTATSTGVATSSSIISTHVTTTTKKPTTTSDSEPSTHDSHTSHTSHGSQTSTATSTTSTPNAAIPLATSGPFGLSAGLAGAALVAFL